VACEVVHTSQPIFLVNSTTAKRQGREGVIMIITVRLVALALGLALASTSFAQGSKPLSAARAKAIHDCAIAAGKYVDHLWGDFEIYVYRACMARHGQSE
jgi:hypothetical protein